jgi:hypothetical protein
MKVKDIDELYEMWCEDAKIDDTKLDEVSLDVARLHSKYLSIMSHHRLIVKKLTGDYKIRKKIKWQYYRGELNNPTDLKKYNLEPLQNNIIRQDVDVWLDADEELNNMLLKIVIHEEIVDVAKEIIRQLHNRNWNVRNAIEWRKFLYADGSGFVN